MGKERPVSPDHAFDCPDFLLGLTPGAEWPVTSVVTDAQLCVLGRYAFNRFLIESAYIGMCLDICFTRSFPRTSRLIVRKS